jgi:molecular chaperone GrpE
MTDENPNAEAPVAEEIVDYKDKYLRLLAETENTRKRLQKEKQETMRWAIENVLADIITPLDSLENALKFTDQMSEETKNWALGFQMILGQFKEILAGNGVAPFTSEGEMFDPFEETDTVPEGTILKEFLKGYRCQDRVIRPAKVKVSKHMKEKNNHDTNQEEK